MPALNEHIAVGLKEDKVVFNQWKLLRQNVIEPNLGRYVLGQVGRSGVACVGVEARKLEEWTFLEGEA